MRNGDFSAVPSCRPLAKAVVAFLAFVVVFAGLSAFGAGTAQAMGSSSLATARAAAGKLVANSAAGGALGAKGAGALTVNAAGASGNYKTPTLESAKGTIHLYPNYYDKASNSVYLDYMLLSSGSGAEKEPQKVKSSNKRVCSAAPGYGMLQLSFEKPGKATVSYTWKGKAHKVKFVVHKWTNLVKSFVVGGKQYAGKFANSNTASATSKFIAGKVKVVAVSGWKVSQIESVKANYASKTIKNGSTTLKKSDKVRGLIVRLKNRASGQEVWLDLDGKGFVIPF